MYLFDVKFKSCSEYIYFTETCNMKYILFFKIHVLFQRAILLQ